MPEQTHFPALPPTQPGPSQGSHSTWRVPRRKESPSLEPDLSPLGFASIKEAAGLSETPGAAFAQRNKGLIFLNLHSYAESQREKFTPIRKGIYQPEVQSCFLSSLVIYNNSWLLGFFEREFLSCLILSDPKAEGSHWDTGSEVTAAQVRVFSEGRGDLDHEGTVTLGDSDAGGP